MKQKLIIAGGGTGGHIFPGIAIAEEWVRQDGEVLFVGTPAGQESVLVPKYGFALKLLKVGRLKGGSVIHKIKTLLGLPFSLLAALRLMLQEKPHAVLGIGGYASGPTCVAARLLMIYTAITDQNVQPGMTNRILGKFVKRAYISFDKSRIFFPNKKVLLTGNPVRSQIVKTEYRVPQGQYCIFVFGGSQGAVALNEGVLSALDGFKDLWPQFKIFHQAGVSDFEKIKAFYEERKINAVVSPFFDNMNEIYGQAHLVICRAGAGTLTELALSGRPCVLVPYPFAADDHQKKNALVFVDAGAGVMVEQSELQTEKLKELMKHFFKEPQELKIMAENAGRLARPGAARLIVEDLLRRGS